MKEKAKTFSNTFQYIDDLLMLNPKFVEEKRKH